MATLINSRSFYAGEFTTPTLRNLRKQIQLPFSGSSIRIDEIVADVQSSHRDQKTLKYRFTCPPFSQHHPMSRTVTWLHLSDLHACKPKSGWDAARVIETLGEDLRRLRDQHNLNPDFLFFTGDLAFGHLGSDGGKSISEQFLEGEKFLCDVRACFDPVIAKENVFLVPGNHDVNRTVITESETGMLQTNQDLEKIEGWIRDLSGDWQLFLGRLSEYKKFLSDNSYQHCLEDGERLIYSATREVAGLTIGIAGFNTAWSSTGAGREEMGELWAAGRFQLETLRQEIRKCQVKICLLYTSPSPRD